MAINNVDCFAALAMTMDVNMLKLNPIKSDKIWGYELWIASTHPNGCQDDFKTFCGGEYPLLVPSINVPLKPSFFSTSNPNTQ